MFSKFTEEAQKILVLAKNEMVSLKHPYVGSEHLLLAILKNKNNEVAKKLLSYDLTYTKFREEVLQVIGPGKEENNWFLYTPLLKRILEGAILEAKETSDGEVSVAHLFLSLLEEGEGVAIRILLGLGIDLDELYQNFSTKLVRKTGTSGKKLMIEEFAVDFNERVLQGEIDPVIARDQELTRIMEILSRRTKNNPLLIGEAGVGKTAIVEALARLIVREQVPPKLRGKRILSLSIAGIVAGTKYRGEFEERVNKLLKEVEQHPEIILFVDEIHTLVGAGGAEGAIDASNILKPILARGKIRLIGATTTEEYKKFIEKDKAFARRFQNLVIEEPNRMRTISILEELRPLYESYHHVVIDPSLLPLMVDLSNRYFFDRKQPDKAIDLLDEVAAKVALTTDTAYEKIDALKSKLQKVQEDKNQAIIQQDFKNASLWKEKEKKLEDKINRLELKSTSSCAPKVVTKEFLLRLLEEKTKIPVYDLNIYPHKYFSHLEENLNKAVLGQEKAIHELCLETRRIQLGLREEGKPSSFLFVGRTGVGKTQLIKSYASYLVGEDHFIRLDMSEYREAHSISKIIGSPPGYVGYQEANTVLEQIRTFLYAVLLLDEIEKAHPSVLQLFLQALDEGKMKTADGRLVRFDHVLLFMTSNIGFSNEKVGFLTTEKSSIISKLREVLSVEFINRIEHIIVFEPLSEATIRLLIERSLKEVVTLFKSRGITLTIDDEVVGTILQKSEYPVFGARKINSIIHQTLDPIVLNQVLLGKRRVRVKSLS